MILHPKDPDGMAKGENPNQTAPLSLSGSLRPLLKTFAVEAEAIPEAKNIHKLQQVHKWLFISAGFLSIYKRNLTSVSDVDREMPTRG